ncbi:MAG: hypothetical protein ACE144_21210 [Thermodesulfobacteriota bacterium]
MMDWGVDFSGDLQKMKEEMDRVWASLFEEEGDEGNRKVEISAKPKQAKKNKI